MVDRQRLVLVLAAAAMAAGACGGHVATDPGASGGQDVIDPGSSGGGSGGVDIEPGGSGGSGGSGGDGGGRVPAEVYYGLGRTDPPEGVFTNVSASEYRSCGVRAGGSIECWGEPLPGVPEGEFVQVSVSEGRRVPHGCALGAEGSVVCWGGNDYGQADAPEGGFVQVSAGGANSCGVRSDGLLSCWGNNEFGQLKVPEGSFTDVYAGSPSCALDAEGSLVCWGRPPAHRRSLPDAPEGEFVQMSAAAVSDGRDPGADYACGLRASGEIVCWAAAFGFHDAYRWVPQASGRWQGWEVLKRTAVSLDYGQADPPPGRFVSVSAAAEHACAINTQGRIVCWGNDYHHQLDPVAPRWGWSISNHYCSLSSDSDKAAPEGPLDCSVYTRAHDYSLPLSGEVAREHPHGADDEFWGVHNGLVDPLRGPFVEVSAGSRGACGVRADAALVCWGVSLVGIEAIEGTVSQVTVGDHHGCALREAPDSSNGNVVCWGIDDSPPPERHRCARKPESDGYCTGTDPEHPQWRQQTEAIAGIYTQLSAGADHTCGLGADTTIACWGANDWGQSDPPEGEFIQVSAVDNSSCALRSDGTPVCWGGAVVSDLVPPPGQFVSVSAAGLSGRPCAIRPNGGVECWGYGPPYEAPPWVAPLTKAAVGFYGSCGIQADAALVCWDDYTKTPSWAPLGEFVDVEGSTHGACALDVSGAIHCAGHYLADPPPGEFTDIAVGEEHACAVRTDGAVACWGSPAFVLTMLPNPDE